MDMKRILQAFDSASTKPVEGADDMRRFVSAIRALNSPITEQSAATPQVLNKIKQAGLPSLEPVNPPPLPQGEVEAGEKVETKPDGTTVYTGGFGTYTYDKTGKPIKYSSPSFSGLTQTTDLITGNITVRYMAGPLDVSQTYDKTGKPTGDKQAQYNLGTQTVGMKQQAGGPIQQTVTPNTGMTQQPAGESVVTENTLRTYIDIVERQDPNKVSAEIDKAQSLQPTDKKMPTQDPSKVAPSTPAGKIDYTKEGPKTKSSQGVELEYGVPINKNGEFMNPQKLPNWDAHSDDEQFEILQAYKAWLRDFTSRWPSAKQRPDGTWGMTQGLAPMAPSMPKFENAGFKDYLQMIEESRMSEIDIDLHDIARNEDFDKLYDAISGLHGGAVQVYLEDMIGDIARDHRLHWDDDIDEIMEILMDRLIDNYGDGDALDEGVAGPKKCWPGHRKVGTQPGTGKNKGKRVNDCEKI